MIKQKEEAPKPTGPIGVLFKKWSGAGDGQKGSKKAKSVDFKGQNSHKSSIATSYSPQPSTLNPKPKSSIS